MTDIPFTAMTASQFQAHLDRRSVNTHDAAAVATFFSESAVQRIVPSRTATGRDGIRDAMGELFRAFPDFHVRVEDLFASGSRICVECTVSGTHGGEYLGLPPTHRRIELGTCLVLRIGDHGLVEEESIYCDFAAMLQQLGALDAPAVDVSVT